jgi:hypothetical protein
MLRVIMASGRSIVPRRRARRASVLLGVDHSLQRFRIRCSQMHVATDMPYVTQIISSLTVHGVEVARETSSEIATDRSGFSRPPRTPQAASARSVPCLKDGREHYLAIPAATSGIGCPSVAESP